MPFGSIMSCWKKSIFSSLLPSKEVPDTPLEMKSNNPWDVFTHDICYWSQVCYLLYDRELFLHDETGGRKIRNQCCSMRTTKVLHLYLTVWPFLLTFSRKCNLFIWFQFMLLFVHLKCLQLLVTTLLTLSMSSYWCQRTSDQFLWQFNTLKVCCDNGSVCHKSSGPSRLLVENIRLCCGAWGLLRRAGFGAGAGRQCYWGVGDATDLL